MKQQEHWRWKQLVGLACGQVAAPKISPDQIALGPGAFHVGSDIWWCLAPPTTWTKAASRTHGLFKVEWSPEPNTRGPPKQLEQQTPRPACAWTVKAPRPQPDT
jgi:hypothetical protein